MRIFAGRHDSQPFSAQAPQVTVHYRIRPARPEAHLFEVTLTLDSPDPAGQCFALPAWIPGSYLIREFARHVVSLRAECDGKPLACEKIDKATWRCAPTQGPITVTCEIYAWDLSVRGAHLDDTHGFFNGACVFLYAIGQEHLPCTVDIEPPEGEAYADWRVATPMPRDGAAPLGFGRHRAASYAELIDHPVEMGRFEHATFEVEGVPHHLALTGRTRADMPRLVEDLRRVCAWHSRFFEPDTGRPPVDEYWFLITAVGDGYGGLEHRASTALLCSRDELPLAHLPRMTEGYRRFLALASHEYFHTWNVKRITPAPFAKHDLTRENYTRDLWFFEGITSYYDELALVRAGLIDELGYLEMLAETLGRYYSTPGRNRQSVSDASFDAWIKYYRADENAVNSQISYYVKGCLIGFALDANIRIRSQGEYSLDDVMRALWMRHGKTGIGVPPGGIEALVAEVTHLDLSTFFDQALRTTSDPDFASLFREFAIDLGFRTRVGRAQSDPPESSLGVKVGARNGDALLEQVFEGGAAQEAGMSAGDTVIAVDGLRVSGVTLERRLRSYPVGAIVTLTTFRRDELMSFTVKLQAETATKVMLTTLPEPMERVARRAAWLRNGFAA
jgi:predicted metalloprotease with PDZ domain